MTATATTRGAAAEQLVVDRLRAVLPPDVALLHGVRWLVRDHGYGNEALENPAVDDAGQHLGAAATEAPELPSDAILCDTIRRFKGLERPVVVLVELGDVDPVRLNQLLYVGASRARQHLVVIAPATVLERLR